MREYLEELSSATFVAIWGVVATIPGKSAPLHSSSGQERQEEGEGELSIVLQKVASEADPKVRNHREGPY